jgi:hypothetical protein
MLGWEAFTDVEDFLRRLKESLPELATKAERLKTARTTKLTGDEQLMELACCAHGLLKEAYHAAGKGAQT